MDIPDSNIKLNGQISTIQPFFLQKDRNVCQDEQEVWPISILPVVYEHWTKLLGHRFGTTVNCFIPFTLLGDSLSQYQQFRIIHIAALTKTGLSSLSS